MAGTLAPSPFHVSCPTEQTIGRGPPEPTCSDPGRATTEACDRDPAGILPNPGEATMKRNQGARALARAVSPEDHIRGSPSAPVTLVGYGDFSNPDCAQTYRTVNKIRQKMGTRLRYVFR